VCVFFFHLLYFTYLLKKRVELTIVHIMRVVEEVGGACGAHGGGEKCAQGSSGETRWKEAIGETQT